MSTLIHRKISNRKKVIEILNVVGLNKNQLQKIRRLLSTVTAESLVVGDAVIHITIQSIVVKPGNVLEFKMINDEKYVYRFKKWTPKRKDN